MPKELVSQSVERRSILGFESAGSDFHHDMPAKIGEYELQNIITTDKISITYAYGLYENAQHQRAFAKKWSGPTKNMDYYWLKNEINVYTGLNQISGRLQQINPHFRVPNLILAQEQPEELLTLVEYVEAVTIESYAPEERIKVLLDAIEFFAKINDELPSDLKLKKRSAWYFVMVFYPAWVLALCRHPRQFPQLLRSLFYFTIRIPAFTQSKNLRFVHRDLSSVNILSAGREFYIIDFEIALKTLPVFELVAAQFQNWLDIGFRRAFIQSARARELITKQPKVYQAAALYTVIAELGLYNDLDIDMVYDFLETNLK